MNKNLVIAALSIIVALLIGYIVGSKHLFSISEKITGQDSIQLYDNGNENSEETIPQRNSAIDFTDARTFQFETEIAHWNGKGGLTYVTEPVSITLFPDGTAMLSTNENTSLNYQLMESSVNGQIVRCLYIFLNEDTSKPAYIISEDGRIKSFSSIENLDYFLSRTVGSIEGEIPVGIFCKAVKISLKDEPDRWIKCKYKDGTSM